MQLKRIDDSAQNTPDSPGRRRIEPINTELSQETREALKQIDANIRSAEQKSGNLLVA